MENNEESARTDVLQNNNIDKNNENSDPILEDQRDVMNLIKNKILKF